MKCVDCSNGASFGNKYCLDCLEKSRQRSSNRYYKMKLQKKCKNCKCKVEKGIYCQECKRERNLRWHDKKEKGLCVVCGKIEASNGLKCHNCYDQYVNNVNAKREQRLLNGCCAFCDKKRVNNRLCLEHFLKFTSKSHFKTSKRHQDLLNLFNEQNGKCPYSGRELTLGIDASLDHIVPKCREGLNDIENLQWVYGPINFMKQDMLHEEFLNMIFEIHKNLAR